MFSPSEKPIDMAATKDQESECLPFQTIDVCQYEEIPFDVACSRYSQFDHVAHCMIYALDNRTLWEDGLKTIASVMVCWCASMFIFVVTVFSLTSFIFMSISD
jgi:hypothetical protein